jgi:serine/threonine protein kinase
MIGRYEITERIAQGGMAEIYKARSLGADGFSKTVVIKRILPEYTQDTEFVGMFVHEAKLATCLDHPNIVQVFDLGKVKDEYFIAMEYVDGPNLHAAAVRAFKMNYRPFPLRECLYVLAEACKGLDYAHRKTGSDGAALGIIHRDISPPNILLSFDGTVKVADFGVAKARDQAVRTRTGVLKGKFGYMSPEQASGLPIDRRSDVFSLGVVMWELLAGKRLFKGPTPLQTVERVVKCEVPPLSTYTADMPPEVDAIVQRALARELPQRYQDCGELGEAISEYLFAASLKVSARDLSNFLRHMFLDERSASGEAVWRPSPMPPPLKRPATNPAIAAQDDVRTAITDVAVWEEMSASVQGAASFTGEKTEATRSARFHGGTLLELDPISASGVEGATRPAQQSIRPGVAQPIVPSDGAPTERIATGLPTIPITVRTEPTGAKPAPAARSTPGAALFHQASPSGVHAKPEPTAARAPAPAAPPKTSAASWIWWTLGTIALAGAMIALIVFSKR